MRRVLLALALVVVAGAAPLLAGPQRIASLNLAADEILVEILPPGRLVGVTRFVDDVTMSNVAGRVPPGVERLPKADIERLMALQPDLVIVSPFSDGDFLHQLEKSGLRTHSMRRLDSLDGVRQAILDLGVAVGEKAAAGALVLRFDERLAELARRLAGAPHPRVLYWSSPYTAGKNTSLGAVIECGGGRNAAAEIGIEGLAPVGSERVFVVRPDYMLVDPAFESLESLRRHPLLAQLPAVRDGRVIALPTTQLSTLSHHIVEACWSIASHLHPDRVAEAPTNR